MLPSFLLDFWVSLEESASLGFPLAQEQLLSLFSSQEQLELLSSRPQLRLTAP